MERRHRILGLVVLLVACLVAGAIYYRNKMNPGTPAAQTPPPVTPPAVGAADPGKAAPATEQAPGAAPAGAPAGASTATAGAGAPGSAAAPATPTPTTSAPTTPPATAAAGAAAPPSAAAGGAAAPATGAAPPTAGAAAPAVPLVESAGDKSDAATASKEALTPAQAAAKRAEEMRARARNAFDRALVAQRAGNLPGAIEAYREALEVDASMAGAWTNLALALDATGQTADGLVAARRAVTLPAMKDPLRRGHAFYAVGHLAEKTGAVDEARIAYEEALQADAKQAAAAVALAAMHTKADEPEKALAILMAAHDAGAASAAVDTNIAVIELRAGNFDAAATHAAGALAITPESGEAKLALGYAQLAQEKWGDAAQRLDEASRTFANDPELFIALGYAYDKLGRREDAVIAFDRAITLRTDSPKAHAFRGMSLEQMGEAKKSMEAYEKAARASTGVAASASQTKLAVVAYKDKRYADARALAEAAVKADPKNAQARYVLGLSAYALGDRKTASEQEYQLNALDKERAAALRKLIAKD